MKSATRAYALPRQGGERLRWGEVEMLVKASGAATGGAFALFEEVDPVDTPLHVHEREDELFFVLEGEHAFQVGEDEFRVGPGGLVFAPRGVPHAQRRVVPRTGRVLVLTAPAGLEGFFRALADADRAGTLGADAYASASERHGITWLTPADAPVPGRPLHPGTRQRVPADAQTTIEDADAYLAASAELRDVGTVMSFDRGLDRIATVRRVEP